MGGGRFEASDGGVGSASESAMRRCAVFLRALRVSACENTLRGHG